MPTLTSPPPSYLAQAILTTLFCCLPLGIVAIVKASQVNGHWQSGRHQEAMSASAQAKQWVWIAFGAGLALIAIGFLLGVIGALGEDQSQF